MCTYEDDDGELLSHHAIQVMSDLDIFGLINEFRCMMNHTVDVQLEKHSSNMCISEPIDVYSTSIWTHNELIDNNSGTQQIDNHKEWYIGLIANVGIIAFRLSIILKTKAFEFLCIVTDPVLIDHCENALARTGREIVCVHPLYCHLEHGQLNNIRTVCMLALMNPTGACNMNTDCKQIHFHPQITTTKHSLIGQWQDCCPSHDKMVQNNYTTRPQEEIHPIVVFIRSGNCIMYCNSNEMIPSVTTRIVQISGINTYQIFIVGKNMYLTRGTILYSNLVSIYKSSLIVCHGFKSKICRFGRQCPQLHLCLRECLYNDMKRQAM
jgi:hypothetical protein